MILCLGCKIEFEYIPRSKKMENAVSIPYSIIESVIDIDIKDIK